MTVYVDSKDGARMTGQCTNKQCERYACFGFLWPNGVIRWACGVDRAAVERAWGLVKENARAD